MQWLQPPCSTHERQRCVVQRVGTPCARTLTNHTGCNVMLSVGAPPIGSISDCGVQADNRWVHVNIRQHTAPETINNSGATGVVDNKTAQVHPLINRTQPGTVNMTMCIIILLLLLLFVVVVLRGEIKYGVVKSNIEAVPPADGIGVAPWSQQI